MTSESNHYNLRSICAKIVFDVVDKGQSLNVTLANYHSKMMDKDRALIQEISFGVIRVLPELEFYVQTLMDRVFTNKNRPIHFLILVGIYQIAYTRVPEHAAASETVNAALKFKKPQLKGVINGVLRSFIRQQDKLKSLFNKQSDTSQHPTWFVNKIKQYYPNNWQNIINANNQKPPMWLRINIQKNTLDEYLQLLSDNEIAYEVAKNVPNAVKISSPIAVTKLPLFLEGAATVQDLHAQHAAHFLEPKNDENILDLCAAPGGKTTHILELAPNAQVLAVDSDKERLKRIEENLKRLNQHATVKYGDGTAPKSWCNNQQFDKILLDAPCSGTGVIRRHPDIKWLRRESDITKLVALQKNILNAIWSYLKPGGLLVYATCSILKEENSEQIEHFLNSHQDAILKDKIHQFLPDINLGDGFFYAQLLKK